MQKISCKLSRNTVSITVYGGALETLRDLPDDSLMVFPEVLSGMVQAMFPEREANFFQVPDGEEGKSFETVMKIVDGLARRKFRRTSTVVSIGGGTVSDVSGLAASLYMRGINYISVPTTLLAMVDAAIGGKNAVNYNGVKNLLGSFYSPSRVIVDTSLVRDMPESLVKDGLGEIAKYAVIMDSILYDMLMGNRIEDIFQDSDKLEWLVSMCIKDKLSLVEEDEFDMLGRRVILNYGHTLGHALEGACGFSIGHGIAVAHGMLMETDMAIEAGMLDEDFREKVALILRSLGLPHTIDRDLMVKYGKDMQVLVGSDKKAGRSGVQLPVPERIGKAKVNEVDLKYIRDYLERHSSIR